MGRYRTRYVWSNRFGKPEHSYEVIGSKGGLHLHISMNTYSTEGECQTAMDEAGGWAWNHSVYPACMKITAEDTP